MDVDVDVENPDITAELQQGSEDENFDQQLYGPEPDIPVTVEESEEESEDENLYGPQADISVTTVEVELDNFGPQEAQPESDKHEPEGDQTGVDRYGSSDQSITDQVEETHEEHQDLAPQPPMTPPRILRLSPKVDELQHMSSSRPSPSPRRIASHTPSLKQTPILPALVVQKKRSDRRTKQKKNYRDPSNLKRKQPSEDRPDLKQANQEDQEETNEGLQATPPTTSQGILLHNLYNLLSKSEFRHRILGWTTWESDVQYSSLIMYENTLTFR